MFSISGSGGGEGGAELGELARWRGIGTARVMAGEAVVTPA